MTSRNLSGGIIAVAAAALLSVGVAAVVAACTVHPIATAQTVQQKAYATYGTFVVYEQLGAKLATDPATPPQVVKAIRAADNAAKPVMDSTLDATLQAADIQGQLAEGKTTQDKLTVALDNLNDWVTKATPLVTNLIDSVRGGK